MYTSDDNDIYFIFNIWVIVNLGISENINRNHVIPWFVFVEIFILEPHHCLKITERFEYIFASTRPSEHLNLVFESVLAATRWSLVLLTILFFIEIFRIRILLFCCFLSIWIIKCDQLARFWKAKRASSLSAHIM